MDRQKHKFDIYYLVRGRGETRIMLQSEETGQLKFQGGPSQLARHLETWSNLLTYVIIVFIIKLNIWRNAGSGKKIFNR